MVVKFMVISVAKLRKNNQTPKKPRRNLAFIARLPFLPPRFAKPPATVRRSSRHGSPFLPPRFAVPPASVCRSSRHGSPFLPPRFARPPATARRSSRLGSPGLPRQLAVLPASVRQASRDSSPFVRICNPHAVNIGICNPAIHFLSLKTLNSPALGFQVRHPGEWMTVLRSSTQHALPK